MAKKATKKKASKKVTKKAAKKATKKKASGKKAGGSFMNPLRPSDVLGAIVGSSPLPRTEVVKKLWAYIKRHGLQDKKNKRMINPDDKLAKVFGGSKAMNMFAMMKVLKKNLKAA
jgi:upstream activation factor subunit UAF30